MTRSGWLICIGLAIVIGVLLGLVIAHFRVQQVHDDAYRDGVLAGQHQAELTHGRWHPADLGAAFNSAALPHDRQRSSDYQLVTRPARDRTPRIVDPR